MIFLNRIKENVPERNVSSSAYLVFGMMLLLWFLAPKMMAAYDQTAGTIDPSISLLILLALLSFLVITALSWWLVQQFWMVIGLPDLGNMVVHFKSLDLWQQLGFYWLSFALLLLAAVGCMVAVC